MKNRAVTFGLAAVAVVFAGTALAALQGTKHDFTSTGAAAGKAYNQTTDMCGSCHVPHKPKQNVPLWAHTLTTQTFQLYDQNTAYVDNNGLTYDTSAYDFSGTKSRACLSCHDGTVAVIGAISLATTDATWILYNDGVKVTGASGNGLLGSHPVAVTYPAAFTDYKDISADADVKLENGKVQCTSCHGAHDNTNTKFLVKSNTNSGLCTTCHNK